MLYTVYLCQRCVRLTFMTYNGSDLRMFSRMELVRKSGTYYIIFKSFVPELAFYDLNRIILIFCDLRIIQQRLPNDSKKVVNY